MISEWNIWFTHSSVVCRRLYAIWCSSSHWPFRTAIDWLMKLAQKNRNIFTSLYNYKDLILSTLLTCPVKCPEYWSYFNIWALFKHVPVYHLELVFEEVCKMPKVNVNIKNIQFIWTTAKRKSTWWWSELYKLILNKKQRCLLRALTDIHKVYVCPYIISSTYYMLRFHKTMISVTRKICKQNGLEHVGTVDSTKSH